MKSNKNYLVVNGDEPVIVEYITRGVQVEIAIRLDKLEIKTKVSHGEGASSWDENYFTVALPEK